jgi:hypothetical protein
MGRAQRERQARLLEGYGASPQTVVKVTGRPERESLPRLVCLKPGCVWTWTGTAGEIPRGCPRCGGVMMTWLNAREVVDWLMANDPEYVRSYTQGG